MIKKAVLPLLTAPFLMVFSDLSFASAGLCPPSITLNFATGTSPRTFPYTSFNGRICYYGGYSITLDPAKYESIFPGAFAQFSSGDFSIPVKTDEECSASNPSSITVSRSSANYLTSGGSFKTHGGTCSISSSGGVVVCSEDDQCSISVESYSTNEEGVFVVDSSLNRGWGETKLENRRAFDVSESDLTSDFSPSSYLNPLPGGCSDNSACLTIGDTSYLVDWDSAPDYFSYVDSNGTVHSKPSSGGGGGDNGGGDNGGGDPTNPTDPTDPGGDNGGGDGDTGGGGPGGNNGDTPGGGGSGGGSTVPDFEFDESGIIEAIGSAGRSNRDAINALSNDVTGAISNQTNELNNATSAQTDALSSALSTQTDSLTSSLDNQTDSVTSALDDQTGILTGALDALSTSIVDAINSLGSGEGEGEGGLWDGLIDSLAGLFGSGAGEAADSFASGLEETTSDAAFDEFDQQGYAEELFDTYESEQIGLLEERLEALLATVDTALSPYRNLISRLIPDVPTSTCTPIIFGSGHMSFTIDCEGFNLLKAMLAWVLYVFTAYTIVSTIFSYRSGAQQGA